MPLWTIYHSENTLSDADKAALAEKLTDIYGRVMPRFYVGIVYQEMKPQNFFIGGKPATKFVRIAIEHIARSFPDAAASRNFFNRVNKDLAPFVAERGYDWEFHIDETPFDYWSINGHFPPRPNTEDEIRWRAENRPSPRTHD
jgi:phenylpyruvate tautomerase PptA (4-oxalocrotonate tautomerase family)